MQQATGELLCFSDADCAYDSPLLLRAAVSFARREGIEFLSVLPRLEANSLWEKVIQPVAGAIMVFWFPPQKVNDPRCREAYANGAFMLMTRRAYEAIGGHEYAKATLNEDMHMARQAGCVGVRLQVLQSRRPLPGKVHVHGPEADLPRLDPHFLRLLRDVAAFWRA